MTKLKQLTLPGAQEELVTELVRLSQQVAGLANTEARLIHLGKMSALGDLIKPPDTSSVEL